MRTPSGRVRTPGRPRVLSPQQIGAAVVDVGFERFSVRALADRLGVGERTLYRYAAGRDGLVALGLEHLMRENDSRSFTDPGPELTWRAILGEVAAGVQAFLETHPAAGMEMARGVRAPTQARYVRECGVALMRRGFGADDALLALHSVFDLVLTSFRDARYLDSPAADAGPSERAVLRERMAPEPGLASPDRDMHAAIDRSLDLSPREWMTKRLDLLLDGVSARRKETEWP